MGVKLNVKDFKAMVNACKLTAAKEDTRPLFKLINIDVRGGSFRMWSADGYRVEVCEIDVVSNNDFKASFENMYIPKFNDTVSIELVENNLEVVFYPSEFKIIIPQNFQGKLWDVDGFIEEQERIEKETIVVKKEFISDALKKFGKYDRVEIRKQQGKNVVTPLEVTHKDCSLRMKTYILPIKSNY